MEAAYDQKFEEMKKYIPFLESMIKRLESSSSASPNPRQAQLDKIRSLRDLLLDRKKRMKMENLLKCEQVLVNLYAKVEQRDTDPVIKSSAGMETTSLKEKMDLETVRNKLKTVVKLQEGVETLPEIARANDIELHYTGSKEPALFQRRPNRSSNSPARSVQRSHNESKMKSPQSQHRRSYTRVLVSPDQSPRRWPASEQSPSDKPLFSRRSPPRTHSPPGTKKEKKKSSKVSKSRKTNDLNITLNVPEESLNSLNTKDILSRIINCSDGDVDIDTLRELRTQILGELKQTGKNDDISDLILKSYNKKTKSKTKTRRKNTKDDVEEGELSDSESEAIESIYGSLVVVDKDKKSSTEVKTTEEKDNQQRKIQICLVINSDKNETNKASEQPQQVIDLSEFEMLSENESDKSKEIISIDSDTSSPSKKTSNKQIGENKKLKKTIEILPHVKNISESINIDDGNVENKIQANEAQHFEETLNEFKKSSVEIINQEDTTEDAVSANKVSNDYFPVKSSATEGAVSPNKKDRQTLNEPDSDQNSNTEEIQKNSVQQPKFIANFYKPIGEELQVKLSGTSCASSSNLPEFDSAANDCKETASEKKTPAEALISTEKEKEDAQKIPLLNEPTVPPKAKTDVLSEIDILQALKNEILSDTIAMPGSETVTPALHQPKLTKVASAQEVMPKKRISIEKYKEKASTSRSKSLFVRKRNKSSKDDNTKKQSLKLTEKECERFNFPKRLSLDDDDDDVNDISDDDFLTEDKDDSLGLDDIYGDLAPKSPDNELTNETNAPPVIIPMDPVKAPVVTSRVDVDMRTLLPVVPSQPQSVPPLIPHLGFGAGIQPSPAYGIDMHKTETNIEQNIKVADISRISAMDPRIRRDTSVKNSPNPYATTNPDRTPRSKPFSNVATTAPCMTPSRTPNMTPSRTPSYMPSTPLLMTSNARSFEMTPSHQSFELEESSSRKHVYAPSFSVCDNRERELSVSKDVPHWEMNRSGRRNRWEESNISTGGPKWEERNSRSNSGQIDVPTTPRYEESYKPKYDRYNNRVRCDNNNYNADRRDSYSKPDGPTTPIPSFGWSECPSTPGSGFGRQEAPMTPSHPFGRSECPPTPSHSFGRSDCPTTPIHPFGRADCPSTPGSAFGRLESPLTSGHSYGRSDCPQTPSHPFGRSEIPFGKSDNSNNQKYAKDPRLNRRQTENELNFYCERVRDYQHERSRKSSSNRSQSNYYSDPDASRSYEREKSVGRNERNYPGDRGVRQYDRDRREPSGRSAPKDGESDRLYTSSRENRYDVKHSRNFEDFGSRRDQREISIGRTSENKMSVEGIRSISPAFSFNRSFGRDPNKDNISFKSDAGRNFTINTSVKSTFQDFLAKGKPIQVFEYSFDARKQRATSVGRSLVRETSVGRTLSTMPKPSETSTYTKNRNDKFKRASSVGRELVNTNKCDKSLLEVKALFESYRSKLISNRVVTNKVEVKKVDINKVDAEKEISKDKNQVSSRSRQDIDAARQNQKSSQSKQPYSPKKNYRDPRMRNELPVEYKNRYRIDRRRDFHDSKKSGIIYSSDNIAKGTIMGSGFGVKNYKIPKIKRVTVEPEISDKEKPESVEKCETKEKQKIEESESLQKTKLKDTKDIIKPIENVLPKIKNKKRLENNKLSNIADDSERRVTRSKTKPDTTQSKEGDSVIKTRISKRSVIYDSESDSGPEKEKTHNTTKDFGSQPKSPSKKSNNSNKTLSPVIEKDAAKKSSDGLIDSSFGIDDMEIFPENIGSDPVIENINALIADLDNDLDSSKISNDSFTSEIENMMGTINSPEGNILGDISEVIENDLNETNEILQQQIMAEKERHNNDTNTSLQGVKPVTGLNTALQSTSQAIELSKHSAFEKSASKQVSFSGSDVTKTLLDDTVFSKVNEAIVSTTEDEQNSKVNENSDKKSGIENTAKNEERSVPDITINKNITDKKEDGLPDSTNEMHCELSSDVTSTYDTLETSKTESEIQGSRGPISTIGSLLSLLQDKSKIKEILSMLDQSSDTEKIKKKLEKLSEIVSDEEDENEEQKKGNNKKEAQSDAKIEEKVIEKIETLKNTEKIDKQDEIDQKNQRQKSCKVLQIPNIDVGEDVHMENNEKHKRKSSSSEVSKGIDQKILDEIYTDSLNPADKEKKNEIEDTSEELNIIRTEEADTNKLDDDERDDEDIDDQPLVKKITKKAKGRKFKSVSNKNKPCTRPAPANTLIKKPRKKPSRELQKLQEDIKEMFMSDDVLNATGIRMCRLAKMVTEKEGQNSGPVVVLEKVKGVQNQDQPTKIRKKPGPKPKNKVLSKSAVSDKVLVKRSKSPDTDVKMDKPKNPPKHKPGPKSKTRQKGEETDPYEFDTDSVTDTNTTKETDEDSSDSENESLASSRSFGSEVLAETKKKPRRKRRGTRGWQSGIIKSKNKKKKEHKPESLSDDSPIVKPQRPVIIPDLNCFTDKTYCFQKGVTTYDCRLCVYSGTDIVNHYKKQHPHTEIPLSRMDPQTAEIAIQQCDEINFQAISKIHTEKYTCRFCRKEFASSRTALETFFWHIVSNHTGEFKHLCSECVNVTRCPFNLDIPPPPKDGGQLIGYICGKCNFTQISLENLKTHVIVRHNDNQTEVYTINLAVMSKKAMHTMLRRIQAKQPRVLRSLRSNRSAADTSDYRDDRSDASEESSSRNSDYTPSLLGTQNHEEEGKQKLNPNQIKSKLTFENDEPSDETVVKMEQEEHDADNRGDSLHFDGSFNAETAEINVEVEPCRGNEIVDYPHFKKKHTDSGAKEYVCCINGNDNHYKTPLLISMKKHIQSKHSEKWDGYCCLCKVIVTLQGIQSDFKDCLSHFLDKHMDEFPVLEKVVESVREENLPVPDLPMAEPTVVPDVASTVPVLPPVIPARVATPPVDRTASPSYIAVRPLAELISKELVKELETPNEDVTPVPFPKIENIVSLGETTLAPSQPNPVYPTTVEPATQPDKPFLYEDMQADVMSKKHRVVLDGMMSRENLVRVFKCAGRFCSFTSDSPEDALLHASTHQRIGGEGALNCAYCNYDACENGIDLVMHVFKDHSRCQYCCPLCFYRAAACQLVGAHYKKAHEGVVKLKNVLRSTAAIASPAPGSSAGILTREVAVQHFVCSHDDNTCNFRTYTPGKFIEHLQLRHVNAPFHPCNLCSSPFTSSSELVVHLRTHGLKLYQCTWCVFGANNEQELLEHAASRHPDRQPQAYVRVITNKDGGQLRVLPLAYLNKSKVPIEDVTPNSTKENPVREAERSIELEKLIGHTLFMLEAAKSQSPAPEITSEENPSEELVELPPENLPEDSSDNESCLEPVSTSAEKTFHNTSIATPEKLLTSMEKCDSLEKAQEELPVVKSEPAEVLKDVIDTEIICLDSDDEESSTMTEKAQTNNNNNTKTTVTEEVTLRRVSEEVSRSSVTDEVSITKITNESTRKGISDDDSGQNIIDLSDDDPIPVDTTAKPDNVLIVKHEAIFKCPKCLVICKAAHGLRKHVKKCTFINNSPCPHKPCTAILKNINELIGHYLKVHKELSSTPMVHFCGICNGSFSSSAGAKMHIKAMHAVKNYSVTMTIDEQGNHKYVIQNGSDKPPELPRISARKTFTDIKRYGVEPNPPSGRARKTSTEIKKRYGVEDIDKLPISPILDTLVYCELCEFGTKVRLNMVRHLQQHAGSMPVPHTAPVNPVPHLETNEKHFDKMVNLASSSVVTRAADKPPRPDTEPAVTLMISPGESSRYPKYVPERQRYTCGAKDCSYISVDMAMFKVHWETLHAGDDEYRCVHCPPHQALDTSIPLTAARILAHLRMHDVSLYACSACSYYHYRKHLVEKHLSQLHKDASVKVVREEYISAPATPPPTVGAPTMDLKAWQCGLCKFTSMLRPEVVNHCGSKHQSKMQFKCAYCPFRTSTKENVMKHQTNTHPTKVEEIFYYFYREGSVPDDADGIPRWKKQRQKLGLEELEVKIEPEPAESVTEEQATRLTPITTPVSIDLNLVKKEVTEEHSPSTEMSLEDLCKKFGQFCEPDGIKYKCCLCNAVREHTKEAIQCHLYEELNYRRWECVTCSYKAFHKNGLNEHMASEHSRQVTQPRALPIDVNIEKWVLKLLDHQTAIIETNIQNLAVQKIQGERVPAAPVPKKIISPQPTLSATDSELQEAFGEFGAPKSLQFSCPKCDFLAKDERDMVLHLESELTKIRWGCTNCSGKYQTFHEAQFHCKSAHIGQQARPKESIRDPELRSGWITAVVSSQRQFMKCIAETTHDASPEQNTEEDSDPNENSLLVARYDEPVHTEEQLAVPAKRPAPCGDSDEERLVIDEPQKKKVNDRQCPYCDYVTTTHRCIREHILRHYHMKPYKCWYCPFDGCRQTVINHLDKQHPEQYKRVVSVQIPNCLPKDITLKSSKRDTKEPDDLAKVVCLYCEKSVAETEAESHVHEDEKPEFAKRGEVVVKCCNCLALRLTLTSLQEHFDVCHPSERLNYAYFKLQVDKREIHCCGHCYKKFKFLRDLKVHHSAVHTSLSLSYTSIPFNHNLHTEGDSETGKRKMEDAGGPSKKRVARKSTSKLPNSAVAKKSTTKLPFSNVEEYSHYGTKPLPLDHYGDVTVLMPMYNTMVEIDVKKLSGILKIDPKVVVKDYKS